MHRWLGSATSCQHRYGWSAGGDTWLCEHCLPYWVFKPSRYIKKRTEQVVAVPLLSIALENAGAEAQDEVLSATRKE